MSPIAGKPVYPKFAEFDSSSPSSSTMPTPSSSTMAILMDSRNMSYSTKSNFGTLRQPASSLTMRPSIFMPYISSWLMSLTQISPQGPSVFSNPDLNTPMTYGRSFTQYWDDSTPHHTNLNLIATSSHTPMLLPRQSEPDSRKSDSFHPNRDVPLPSPHISIFVNEPFPFIRLQIPSSISLCIESFNHSGPPFQYFTVPHRFHPESVIPPEWHRNPQEWHRNDRNPPEWHQNGSIPQEWDRNGTGIHHKGLTGSPKLA